MKAKIIIWFVLILLFSSMKCSGCFDVGQTWNIIIINSLPYPIDAVVIFNSDLSRLRLIPIASGEEKIVSDDYVFENPEAHKGINKISIFSEDKTPLIILRGIEMDEYVIFERESGGACWFSLEVEEEYEGIGLNKGINLNEPAIDSHLHGNDEN